MSQTTIVYPLPIGIAGQLADTLDNDVLPGFNADTGNIGFGLVVMKGTNDNDVLQMTGSAVPVGVCVHSHVYDNGPNGELDTTTVNSGATVMPGLKPKTVINVLRKGRIYVVVEEAVNQYDRAWIRIAAGSGGTANNPLGGFRKSADSGSAVNTWIKNFQYLTSAPAGGIALLDVDMLLS